MSYTHITSEERYTMSTLRIQGYSLRKIGTILGRHHTTISRELDRNSCHRTDSCYRPSKAHARAIRRRYEARRNQRYSEQDFKIVRELLAKDWSPEQINGHLKSIKASAISHETIYKYIWQDKSNNGKLWKHLRQSPKQRRKRYKAYDSRGRLADKRHITERPLSADFRSQKGHWEIDTVHGRGSKSCILTLVDRKTGFLLIGKLNDKTASGLNKRLIKIMSRYPNQFKSITADNGTEFHHYAEVEKQTNTKFYFANPYHSWERGTNENCNGLIRQYLPKNKSMHNLTQKQCNQIADKINTRPRKRYDYKSPKELF